MKKALRILCFFTLLSSGFSALYGQDNSDGASTPRRFGRHYADTSIRVWGFSGNGGMDIPGGDLLYRYGNNGTAGASMWYKSQNNFLFSLDWNYLFGGTIRESGILDSIETADGHVIDKEGKYADIRMFERGFTLNFTVGKILHAPAHFVPNKSSGILVAAGIGMLQHKIKILDNGSRTPQLRKEYLKGYDRLTSGIAFNEFIGYWFMSKNQYVNFYFGAELYEGFTMSRRSWDTDLMRADTEHRLDLLTGLKFGWVIPFYHKETNTYHYY